MKKPNIKCEICDIEFYKSPYKLKKSLHHFCSNICKIEGFKTGIVNLSHKKEKIMVNMICENCNNGFLIEKRLSKNRKLCSKKCISAYKTKTGRYNCKCCVCKKEFNKITSEKNLSGKDYCSRKCYLKYFAENISKNRKTGINKNCLTCGKEFYVQKCLIKEKVFCCRNCKDKYEYKKPRKPNKTYPRSLNHHSYIKDRNKIKNKDKSIRESIEMREWRKAVFKRDRYTCQMCGKVGGRLNAHHILQFKFYPQHRFNINNGATVCEYPCHKKTFKKEKQYEQFFFNILKKRGFNVPV